MAYPYSVLFGKPRLLLDPLSGFHLPVPNPGVFLNQRFFIKTDFPPFSQLFEFFCNDCMPFRIFAFSDFVVSFLDLSVSFSLPISSDTLSD